MTEITPLAPFSGVEPQIRNELNSTGVSWPAVVGGAFVTAAVSLILLALGAGLGFASVSPWSNAGASASVLGAAAIVWLMFTQFASSSLGGYLAGRLRTRWPGVHTDEVYFRDTAHGFLAWAVALVITAAFLTSAAASLMGAAVPRNANADPQLNPTDYFVDELFRSDSAEPANDSARAEAGTILATALREGSVPPADQTYLIQMVDSKTGIGRPAAGDRVSRVFAQAQQTADTARKAIAHSLLWIFVALLMGAFCASIAATIGGRQRDHVIAI
jgi:hypothetical protein